MDKPPVIILVLHPMPTPESDMDTTHHGFDHTHDMGWTAVAVAAVAPYVHRFSINTYDFKHPGPNAPLPWVKKCIESWISGEKKKSIGHCFRLCRFFSFSFHFSFSSCVA